MRLALFLTAAACLAASTPAQAGGIGNAVSGIARAACPTAQAALSVAGLIPGAGAVVSAISNGAVFPATVVNPDKMGAGYQAGDQVQVTVHDVNTCRFSVAPAGSKLGSGGGPKGAADGGKGLASPAMSPRASAAIAARSGRMDVGGEAALPYIEFGLDGQGRLVRR
jgi:hypothetical protein